MTDLGLIHNSFAHDNEQQSGAKFPRDSQAPSPFLSDNPSFTQRD